MVITQEEVVKKAIELRDKKRDLKTLEDSVKALKAELLSEMDQQGWKSVDLPDMLKLTIVSFIKESVSQKAIVEIKTLIKPDDLQTVVQTKEFVNKEGIKHLRVILTKEQLENIIGQTPIRYVKLTDRDKE